MKFKKTIYLVLFAILYICVAFVSTLHAISFFSLANALWLGIILACTFEIGQAAVLFSILTNKGNEKKIMPWCLMGVLTLVQILGNVFSSYKYVMMNSIVDLKYFKEPIFVWTDLPDNVTTVIVTYIIGAILPVVALCLTSMVTGYLDDTEEQQKNNDEINELREQIEELKNKPDPEPQIIEKEVIKEVPVEVEKEVIKEVPVEVEKIVEKEVPVEVEKIVEKEVIKEVPVEVIKEVPVEVEKIVEKEVPVEVEKIVEKEVIKEVPVEVEKIVEKEVPVEVEKIVEKEVPVEVEKIVEKEVIKEVPIEVIKEVPVEVEKIIEKEVPVEVEKIVEKEVIKEVPVEVIKEVPVEVEKIVEKEVPVEVEKIVEKEVIKEVPVEVEKIVEKEVPVEVEKIVEKEVIKEVPVEVEKIVDNPEQQKEIERLNAKLEELKNQPNNINKPEKQSHFINLE